VTPANVFKVNKEAGMHTLFLLDLRPDEDRWMTTKEASEFLIKNGLSKDEVAISCAAMGSDNPIIKKSKLGEVPLIKETPQCLIIPGNLHFIEEELIEKFE